MSSSEDAGNEAAAPRRSWLSELSGHLLVAGCVIGIAFLLLQLLTFGHGRDQGIYAMVARIIAAGKMPYRDAWDFKPPGVFLVYLIPRIFFGSSQAGIRIVEAVGLVGMVAAMMSLTGRWWGERRIGLLGGLVAVLAHVQLDFWHTAQPESFGGMLTIYALAALGDLADRPEQMNKAAIRRLILVGFLFGFTGLLKPPLAGGGGVVALALGWRALKQTSNGEPRWKVALRPAAWMTVGGAIPFVLTAIWFISRGAMGDLRYVLFVFTPYYTKLSWVGETLTGMVYWGFTEWLQTYCSVCTVGVMLAMGLDGEPRERFGARMVAGIIAVHLVGVTMQGKFFPYHYGATWPLTGLLAGLGLWRLWLRMASLSFARFPAFAAFCAFITFGRSATKDLPQRFQTRCEMRMKLFTTSPRDQVAIDKLASVADVNAVANRAVAEQLRARVPADRTVFVWGFEPVIYDLADRMPATRYLYDVPQRVAWAKERERAVLMDDLEKNRPAAIVVEHNDVFPMVTGDAIDSADTLNDFAALREMIESRYEYAGKIEDFEIFYERP